MALHPRSLENGLIDYEQVEELAKKHNPKLIIAGGSAYSRKIDFKKFREVADLVGAYLMVDMAHYSGLIAAGEYPNPIEFADVVTSTTHKTIRGPRGGMILSNNNDLGKKFNSAVFPGLQGGPLMHVIAAKAVAFGEALKPEFKTYIKAVISNAQILGETLIKHGFNLASGGTDTHLLLVDLTPKNLTGNVASTSLERANITCNKNSIPFDPKPPKVTSGIRIGTPAATTRGFNNDDFIKVGNLIAETLEGLQKNSDDNSKAEESVKAQVKELCDKYPIYN